MILRTASVCRIASSPASVMLPDVCGISPETRLPRPCRARAWRNLSQRTFRVRSRRERPGAFPVRPEPGHQVVRFDSNVGAGLAWEFKPVERQIEVKVGEQALAFYRATNRSDRSTTGTATFNVSPPLAGAYFVKIECFCFTEQRLEPGQSVEMPVMFYIDPAIADDPDVAGLVTVTLSYTFYPADEPARVSHADAVSADPAQQPH